MPQKLHKTKLFHCLIVFLQNLLLIEIETFCVCYFMYPVKARAVKWNEPTWGFSQIKSWKLWHLWEILLAVFLAKKSDWVKMI